MSNPLYGTKFWNNSLRYVWFSTPQKSGGISSGSPLHYTSFSPNLISKPLLITEGALKATTILFFRSNIEVIANAGVNCSHQEIIKAARHRLLFVAFDTDYLENIHVARAIAKLLFLILIDSKVNGYVSRISILSWETNFKGIDEALLENVSIKTLSIFQWLKSLRLDFQQHILEIFPLLSQTPSPYCT